MQQYSNLLSIGVSRILSPIITGQNKWKADFSFKNSSGDIRDTNIIVSCQQELEQRLSTILKE